MTRTKWEDLIRWFDVAKASSRTLAEPAVRVWGATASSPELIIWYEAIPSREPEASKSTAHPIAIEKIVNPKSEPYLHMLVAVPNPERYIETKSVRHALLALLDSRDFLGHQLSHAQEIIDDEQMEEIEDEYFERRRAARPPRDELYRYARDILSVIGERCDSDVMAEMLSVDIDEATEVLRHVLTQSKERQAIRGDSSATMLPEGSDDKLG